VGISSFLDSAQKDRPPRTTMGWRDATLLFLMAAFSGSTAYTGSTSEILKNSTIRFAPDVAPILREKCITSRPDDAASGLAARLACRHPADGRSQASRCSASGGLLLEKSAEILAETKARTGCLRY